MTESPPPLTMLLSRHTRRREFIALLGAAAIVSPYSVLGQKRDRVPRVGVLMGLLESDPLGKTRVEEFQQGAHDSSPQFWSLNHWSPAKRNASGSAPVRRLRAEADINLPTIPDESVENDVVDDARSRHRVCQRVIVEQRITGGAVHMQGSTIGVDLAKNVFQVHGVDNAGKVVITRQLRRKQARAPGAAPASRADRPSWATAVVVRWSLEISDHAARDQALFLIGF